MVQRAKNQPSNYVHALVCIKRTITPQLLTWATVHYSPASRHPYIEHRPICFGQR